MVTFLKQFINIKLTIIFMKIIWVWNYRDSFWCSDIVTIQYFFKSIIFGCISYCQASVVWTEYIYTWYKSDNLFLLLLLLQNCKGFSEGFLCLGEQG